MTQDTYRTLIVSAAAVEQMRSLASTWTGGVGMWERPLYQDSAEPTHYVSTGLIDSAIADMLPCYHWQQGEEGEWIETIIQEPDYNAMQAAVPGLTVEQIDALMPHCDISTQPWQEALERLGVKLVPLESNVE